MVWSQYSILNIVIHGAQTPKYKIVYVNHLPEYCPVMLELRLTWLSVAYCRCTQRVGEGDFDTWDQVAAGSNLEFSPHIALFAFALVRLCDGEIQMYDGLKCEVYLKCIRINR